MKQLTKASYLAGLKAYRADLGTMITRADARGCGFAEMASLCRKAHRVDLAIAAAEADTAATGTGAVAS